VMENVRGLLSAAITHRPLRRRGPGYPRLAAKEELGSAFPNTQPTLNRSPAARSSSSISRARKSRS
jgi:hypothetical protein